MKFPQALNLAEIAALIGGRVQGPPDLKLAGYSANPLAATATELAFLFEAKLLKRLNECGAGAVVVPESVEADLAPERSAIFVARPMLAIQRLLSMMPTKRYYPESGIHPTAIIDGSAEIDDSVAVGPNVVIGPATKIGARTIIMANTVIGGEVTIGEDCLIHPGCLIADHVKIGSRCIFQQGACIGADGYGYVTERISNMELKIENRKDFSDQSNPHLKIPQIGTVLIEDDVEVGSCTTIDRATIGATVIGKGTKIDNLVMIAHNCRIGREVLIVGQSALAGSCVVADRAVIAGSASIKDHIHIGKDAIVEGTAGVMRDIPEHDVQVGIPSVPVREFFSQIAIIRRLPKMHNEMKSLQKRVLELESIIKKMQEKL